MIPACFVCGSEYICSHREHELRPYWQRLGGEYPTAGTVASVREYRAMLPAPASYPTERIPVQRDARGRFREVCA